MDIGKPVRIHNIPDPHRIDWEENPYLPKPIEQPIPVPDWPTKKPVEVETDG